jgi:glycine/D-amino acid oxidase-like deaminating enzyme
VVGGGIAGLLTAYYAAPLAESVTVLGLAAAAPPVPRPIRHDFPDVRLASLAAEAHRLWLELQARSGRRLLRNCGHLTLARAGGAPDAESHGARGYEVLAQLGLRREALTGAQLARRFPQFTADAGWLDVDAGLVDIKAVTAALASALRDRGVTVHESSMVRGIGRDHGGWHVATDYGVLGCDNLVITADLDPNGILELLPDCRVRIPLQSGQPAEATYFMPSQLGRPQFTDLAMPAFAYPGAGIYGEPIMDGQAPLVRIALRREPVPDGYGSAADFVAACMPALRNAPTVSAGQDHWTEAAGDQPSIGPVLDGVYAAVGWGGPLSAFAPWVGLVLAQLAIDCDTSYDIARFSPARFG